MKFSITNKQIIGNNLKRLVVKAEDIARKIQPAQFVMVAAQEKGEWIPMSVVEADTRSGSITMIVQETGPSTTFLGGLTIGDELFSIMGPFGRPVSAQKVGVVICVASGFGAAQILPVCRAYKNAGNRVVGVMGAKTKNMLMLESQMRIATHKLFIATEDGSYERRGLASELVKQLLTTEKVSLVYAAGSVEMMKDVCAQTQNKKIKTLIQVSPVMACGSGLCGSCQVKVDGKMVLACVEGPQFDGHTIDWQDFYNRHEAVKSLEQKARENAGGRGAFVQLMELFK